jgi:diacylglycerol kinase family enzyme
LFIDNDVNFIAFVTHEHRSSMDKTVLAPESRFDDGKINILSYRKIGRIGALNLVTKM